MAIEKDEIEKMRGGKEKLEAAKLQLEQARNAGDLTAPPSCNTAKFRRSKSNWRMSKPGLPSCKLKAFS
jgi:hypothetical protein